MNAAAAGGPLRVAYMTSRFPKLTETFVLDEMMEMERQGTHVELFPLWREREAVMHDAAHSWTERAHYLPTLSLRIVLDNLYWLARRPARYLSTLARLVGANARSPRYLGGALAAFPKCATFARRARLLNIDHIHAHFASHPAASAFVIGRLTDIPWSFTAHGSDLHREQAMLTDKVKHAIFTVAVSSYNQAFITARVPAELTSRVRMVHCGINPAEFQPCGERAPCAPVAIVCIGTLHEVKGQRHLLDACAGLGSSADAWTCHLIGDGPDRVELEAHARSLGIHERVKFHGACSRAQVVKLLGTMDIACAPSVPTEDGRREGIPVALMEGAACALPLVASRISGIPELVVDNDSGILTEPGDPGSIRDALARLIAEPALRRRLGAGARSRLQHQFCLQKNVAQLKQLMAGARCSP